MAEFTSNAVQQVQLNSPILFNSALPACKCSNRIYHENGSGIFLLQGPGMGNRLPYVDYQVTFNGNIAVPEGGTAGPIAVAITLNGEPRLASRAIVTPAAVDTYDNVTSTAIIRVPRCCGCFSVSVEYISGTDDPTATPAPIINVQNANLVIE